MSVELHRPEVEVSGYGIGFTGQPGVGVAELGSLQRHAVPLPWPPGAPYGDAVCGRRVVLNWIWGQPMTYSLRDGSLCAECVQRLRAASNQRSTTHRP